METLRSQRLRTRLHDFLDGRAKKNLNFSTEKEKQISSIDKLDETVLKRMLGQKGRKDGLL